MWAFSSVLCVTLVVWQIPALKKPPPPSGTYSRIVFPPTDCIQLEWLPQASGVVLLIDCGHMGFSDAINVDERTPFFYEVAEDSKVEYNEFVLLVGSECPYRVRDGDLYSYDYDWKAKTVKTLFESETIVLQPGECPHP
ncbi:hypothetical protein FOZ63_004693 [Perkinsus olseni]|uniref:Uncharacterized protein n=1 Tax=Perkinsus olseni TaxID=32597 RepID=A0A7J6U142_PEROL|nr:hypothetical protein FOZ62_027148 [Perkinsus olseni]KAF4750481.1 hypothetical protein FOZ63_004693 [Perkinsus olseni]